MAELIIPLVTKTAILTALSDTDGVLDALKVMLFSNNIAPTELTAFADLSAPAFTGYALSALVVWQDPFYRQADGAPTLVGNALVFRSVAGAPFVPGVAYGYGLVLPGAPSVLRGVVRFDTPFVFDQADRVLIVTPQWPYVAGLLA